MVHLKLSVVDPAGDPLSPAILQIFAASQGNTGIPAASFSGNENGLIEARFQKKQAGDFEIGYSLASAG